MSGVLPWDRSLSEWDLHFGEVGQLASGFLRSACSAFPVLGLQTYSAIVGFLCGYWGFEFCSSCFAYWAIFSVPQMFYLKKIFFNCLNYVKSDSGVTWFHIHYWSIYVTICSVFYSSNTQRQVYSSEILQGRDVVEGRGGVYGCVAVLTQVLRLKWSFHPKSPKKLGLWVYATGPSKGYFKTHLFPQSFIWKKVITLAVYAKTVKGLFGS